MACIKESQRAFLKACEDMRQAERQLRTARALVESTRADLFAAMDAQQDFHARAGRRLDFHKSTSMRPIL